MMIFKKDEILATPWAKRRSGDFKERMRKKKTFSYRFIETECPLGRQRIVRNVICVGAGPGGLADSSGACLKTAPSPARSGS
jgi:hypothetical protein